MRENDFDTNDIKHIEKLFIASNEGLWTMFADGTVTFFNKNFYENFELDLENATLEEWVSLIHPEDRKGFSSNVDLQIDQHIQKFVSEYRVKHKKGHYIWLEAKGVATFDENDQFEYMVGSHSVITERKRTEAKIYKPVSYTHLTLPTKRIV